jgi:hypothetical protein
MVVAATEWDAVTAAIAAEPDIANDPGQPTAVFVLKWTLIVVYHFDLNQFMTRQCPQRTVPTIFRIIASLGSKVCDCWPSILLQFELRVLTAVKSLSFMSGVA